MATPGTTWTRTKTVRTGQGSLTGGAETLTKAVEYNADLNLPAGSTNVEIDVAWALAKMHGIVIIATKNDTATGTPSGVTLFANSTGTPVDTTPVAVGHGIDWLDGFDPAANKPFPTGNVTKLYGNNSGPVIVRLQISVLIDAS